MMYAVVRIRGNVGVRKKINDTMSMLNLDGKFNCTFLPETDDYRGMLQATKDYITWGEVDETVVKDVMSKRGEAEDIEKIIKGLKEGKSLSHMNKKRFFRLSPPSGGFKKSTKKPFPKGETGYRGEDINKLIERMV